MKIGTDVSVSGSKAAGDRRFDFAVGIKVLIQCATQCIGTGGKQYALGKYMSKQTTNGRRRTASASGEVRIVHPNPDNHV